MTGRLRDLGGTQDFSGDPDATLTGEQLPAAALAARLGDRRAGRGARDEAVPRRLPRRTTTTRPRRWTTGSTTPAGREMRCRSWATWPAAAELHGFAGIALDQELYPQRAAPRPRPGPGTTRATPTLRPRSGRPRGSVAQQLMGAILDGFPGAELAVYHFSFPGDWNEVVQEEVNRGRGRRERPPAPRLLGRDDACRGLLRDPLLRLDLLQDPASRDLGQRAHLRRQPGLCHFLAPLRELGLRI